MIRDRERFARHRIVAGVALVGLLLPFLVPITARAERLVWNPLMDFAHLPVWCVATGLAIVLATDGRTSAGSERVGRRIVLVSLVCVLVAISAELVQPYLGRSATFRDARNSLLGVILGASGTRLWMGPRTGFLLRFGLWSATTVVVTFYVAGPWLHALQAWEFRRNQFPILGDFEDPRELTLWVPASSNQLSSNERNLDDQHASHGLKSLQIRPVGRMGGVIFRAGETDWQEYEFLQFELWSPSEARLGLRIDDDRGGRSWEERFEVEFPVEPGRNHYRIPMESIRLQPRLGPLNLARVRRIVLYFLDPPEGVRFHLDHVRLTSDSRSSSRPGRSEKGTGLFYLH